MAGDQRLLASQRQRPDPVLHDICIHLDPPVGEEHLQPVPVVGHVSQFLAQAGLRQYPGALLSQPHPEVIEQRRGPCLAHGQPDLGRPSPNRILDGVHGRDAPQPFGGDHRAVAVVNLVQLALESIEKALGVVYAAPGRVEERHAGRVRTGPGSLIAGQRPQIRRLGLAPARVQRRRLGLVHEQVIGPLQVPGESSPLINSLGRFRSGALW